MSRECPMTNECPFYKAALSWYASGESREPEPEDLVPPGAAPLEQLEPYIDSQKFVDGDVTPQLRRIAERYAAGYDGDFDLMQNLKGKLTSGRASTSQVRAVLNCMRAELLRDRP